jgi:hypothetical protein
MSSLADAIYLTKYNPFRFGEHIASFYLHLSKVEGNLLLAPLIIPLCSHSGFLEKLENARFGDRRRSTIWTIFPDRTKLADLQERVDSFRSLTDESLQYCLVNDWIGVDPKNLSVTADPSKLPAARRPKSAMNLGKLFKGLSVVEIYVLLGVRPG